MSNEDYLNGVRAAQSYYKANCYGYSKHARAEDVMRLHWPPVDEQMVQFSTPLPRPRQDWIRGFKEEQAAILAEEAIHESSET